MSRITIVAVLVGCLVSVIGCGSKSGSGDGTAPTKADVLHEVAGLIGSYTGEQKKGPIKVSDLARYEAGYPLGFRAISTGEFVVVWGVPMVLEEGSGGYQGSEEVVAYEKQATSSGGFVLFQNGNIKEMTAAEFNAAPKAAAKK